MTKALQTGRLRYRSRSTEYHNNTFHVKETTLQQEMYPCDECEELKRLKNKYGEATTECVACMNCKPVWRDVPTVEE